MMPGPDFVKDKKSFTRGPGPDRRRATPGRLRPR